MLIREVNPSICLEVDGGIDDETAPVVAEAGATVLVAGSHIFGAPDIPEAVRRLRQSAQSSAEV